MPNHGIRRKGKTFKKRDRRLGEIKLDENGKPIDDRDTKEGQQFGYKDIVRENAAFEAYYRKQNICPETEFDSMMEALKKDLPSSFRITGFRSQANALHRVIQEQVFKELMERAKDSEDEVMMPECLAWYPRGMAYQLNLTRKDIRRKEVYFKLHNFLIAETETGNISRQESVSMIPPLVLDVKPHHKVLDMCAAPGSKTAQLIEALHDTDEGVLPTGFVVANDSDNSRCYMLTHQAKRLQSPAVVICNHDAAVMPNFHVSRNLGRDQTDDQPPSKDLIPLKFDRILCDVPCTGDGTMRKNPDIWPKWTPSNGCNLHGVQYRILKRGIEMLEVGGRLVYSTCSLNPIEDEAVIHRMLSDSDGSVELVDISQSLPGLKYAPGLSTWCLSDKSGKVYNSHDEIAKDTPESNLIRPQMFPPSPEKAASYNLNRSLRILPHLQNSGGFFVACLEKKALCPWESEKKSEMRSNQKTNGSEQPPSKKRRFFGFREDPFIYLKKDETMFDDIQKYYDLNLSYRNFLHRSRDETKKKANLYFTTVEVRNLVENNDENVKIINTGVKAFTRCENKGADCDFRIAQEGSLSIISFMKNRILHPTRDDLEILLVNSDFDMPPKNSEMSQELQDQLEKTSTGSVALVYQEKQENGDIFTVEIVGWKGKHTLRAYVAKNERIHYLHLIGGDVSKYDTNKFEEKEKRKREAEKPEGDQASADQKPATEGQKGQDANGDDKKEVKVDPELVDSKMEVDAGAT